MGKRRRNTAKTGDQGIYKSRASENKKDNDDSDNDNMYDKVDRFHNERDAEFIKIDQDGDGSDSSATSDAEEAIMDLGGGGDSSSDEDDSSSEEEQDDGASPHQQKFEEHDAVSSSDSEDEFEVEDARNWGKKKSNYYRGDTADLEIGQDEEDAVVEEEAAKELVKARYEAMDEDDFVLDEPQDSSDDSQEQPQIANRDVSKLPRKEKEKLLEKQHPEMLPLLSHFADGVGDLERRTMVCTKALFEGEEGTPEAVGATPLGQEYLLTKSLLQSTTALNLAMYLLLKSEMDQPDSSELIQSHPVMASLQKFNKMGERLAVVEAIGLDVQMDNLVKASALMAKGGLEDDESSSNKEDEGNYAKGGTGGEFEVHREAPSLASASEEEYDASSAPLDGANEHVMNEARFGLRAAEISMKTKRDSRIRRAVDFGDSNDGGIDSASKSLASTLNRIEQLSASRKRRIADAEMLDEPNLNNEEVRKGLDMMEDELRNGNNTQTNDEATYDDPELEADGDEFYEQVKQRGKSRKADRQKKYAVAPKYPRLDAEVEGERAISRTILKNRGLVAHKNKLNRNPRVKKREQYRKRQIQRKGAVREVRTDEGHKYAGEATGIKSGLSRSRTLRS